MTLVRLVTLAWLFAAGTVASANPNAGRVASSPALRTKVAAPVALPRGLMQPTTPLRAAIRRGIAGWALTLRSPRRLIRLGVTSGVSVAVGLAAQGLTLSPAAASSVAYAAWIAADRVYDRLVPRTRPFGTRAPPPLGRDVAETLVGAAVAGVATPLLISSHGLVAGGMSLLGGSPRFALAQPVLRMIGGLGASMLATGAQMGLDLLLRLRGGPKPTATASL